MVRTSGVVFGDLDNTSQRGFYIQHPGCDNYPDTSDGLYVYLATRQDVVTVGDLVEVTGLVQEYYGMTEISSSPISITVLSRGNPLPAPVDLNPPRGNIAGRIYFESLEAMRVGMGDATVVGPTNESDETWLVRSDLGMTHVLQDDPQGTGEILCVDKDGLYDITPDTSEAQVGDRIVNLEGALHYSMGVYHMRLLAQPLLIPQTSPQPEPLAEDALFRVATFNLSEMFDTYDDPNTKDVVLGNTEYQRRLQKRALAIHSDLDEPELLAVQEVETLTVTQELAARPEILTDYGIVWADTPDERGQDVALFYDKAHFSLSEVQVRQGCTSLVDGLGPDGNGDVTQPQNVLTCDVNGGGGLDGNRLFSRPPLIVRLQLCPDGCSAHVASGPPPMELTVIVNHWKSKNEDTSTVQYTLPRRLQEAQFVANLVRNILTGRPFANLIVLGDLNDYSSSQPLAELTAAGVRDLAQDVPPAERYTYIYQGVSQVLDHILFNSKQPLRPSFSTAVHINADYPYVLYKNAATSHLSSDHDPFVTGFLYLENRFYMPAISRNP